LVHLTPYPSLLYFTKSPNCASFKIFGGACYPHTFIYNINKFQYHSTPYRLFPCHRVYEYVDSDAKIFISKGFIFEENIFHIITKTNFSHCSTLILLVLFQLLLTLPFRINHYHSLNNFCFLLQLQVPFIFFITSYTYSPYVI